MATCERGVDEVMNKQPRQYQGYTIEYNPKPYVAGHDWDAYKPGEEEQGFTAPSRDAAIDMIDILMIESEADDLKTDGEE